MKLKVTIAVDDVHPEVGWGIQGDPAMKWMDALNKKYGAKFTFFIPSNYHGKYPISQHKDWIDWLLSLGYIELAAHGHFHQTSSASKFGECEFFEPREPMQWLVLTEMMMAQWDAVYPSVSGWRNPGWLIRPDVATDLIGPLFDYVAVHEEHNNGIQWPCKMLFGHDGIHSEFISVHPPDRIMFQSHIAGDWNDNVWNQQNYEQLDASLSYLVEEHEVEFLTMYEMSEL